jgi:hypothetical protein
MVAPFLIITFRRTLHLGKLLLSFELVVFINVLPSLASQRWRVKLVKGQPLIAGVPGRPLLALPLLHVLHTPLAHITTDSDHGVGVYMYGLKATVGRR